MKTAQINNRIIKIRAQMKSLSLDALVITQYPNIQYTTGFTGHDSWTLITHRNIYLLTDSRYYQQARKQCPAAKIIQRKNILSKTTADILNRQRSIRIVGVENRTPFNIYADTRKKLNAKTKPANYLVEKIRQSKDITETKNIQRAGEIAILALKSALKKVKPGITEAQLAALIDYNINYQASKPGFETIVAFGSNASNPHYQPANKKLKKNDTILIDYGAAYKGYTCDITRCFVVGKPAEKYLKAYQAVYNAQKAAINAVKPGTKVADVEKNARMVIDDTDFPQYGHGTGHGLGLEVHELPVVSQKIKKQKLHPGHVITIEPGIYIPGKLGIRIEDDILVTENGFRKLTPDDFNTSPEPLHIQV